MRRFIRFAAPLILLSGATHLLAHNPRIVSTDTVLVQRPAVSQAFYGTLAGKPAVLVVESLEPFDLHVALMAPKSRDAAPPDLSVSVTRDDTVLFTLAASSSEWQVYHEFFTWDNYFQGPQHTTALPPGRYLLTLTGAQQNETYALVVGTKERWPPGEIFNTFALLPRMKRDYFGKSPWIAWFNPFSVMMAGAGALLVGLVVHIVK